ncbi:hypothetical protein ACHABX_12655 [Nesterenkonia halotolerans]|uniref:hypothetical protein n=1 Tax=Nesterenkonia halotolerans TaxID=225325 RepID=UPI003EE67722
MTTVTERLRVIRRIYRARGDARTIRDLGFTVYVAALMVLFVVFPMFYWVVALLTQQQVLALLSAPSAGHVFGVACGVVLVAAAMLSKARGPVAPSPFFATVLAGTDVPRRHGLLRPFVISTLLVATGGSLIGVLLGGVLVVSGSASHTDGALFAVTCFVFSILVSVVWLASQSLNHPTWVLPTVLLSATVLTAVIGLVGPFTPWGWVGLLWPAEPSPSPWPLILLGGTAVIWGACVPRLLDGLEFESLRRQGEQWRSASTAAGAGDFSTALAGFRAKPAIGRTWTAVSRHPVFVRFLLRDLIGGLRTPGRFVTGMGFLVLASWVSALAFIPGPWPSWVPAAIGSGLGYLALGVFCDGLRHAAETAGEPPIYGYTTTRLYLLHSLLPLALSLFCAAVGLALANHAGVSMSSAGAMMALAVLTVVVRAYDSAKGPLPINLLTPTPSPVGDASGLMVLSWQADALLIAAIAGGAVSSVATTETSVQGLLVAALVAGFVMLRLRRRLQEL